MSWKWIIVSINVVLYFMQFLFRQYSMYFFAGLIFSDLIAALMCIALENKEISKAFLLSALVVLLIGPAMVIVGGTIVFVMCSLMSNHHL